MIRAEILLTTAQDVNKFVSIINRDGSADKYILTNVDGDLNVSARSYLGALYAATEFGKLYLVNQTEDGKFPMVSMITVRKARYFFYIEVRV